MLDRFGVGLSLEEGITVLCIQERLQLFRVSERKVTFINLEHPYSYFFKYQIEYTALQRFKYGMEPSHLFLHFVWQSSKASKFSRYHIIYTLKLFKEDIRNNISMKELIFIGTNFTLFRFSATRDTLAGSNRSHAPITITIHTESLNQAFVKSGTRASRYQDLLLDIRCSFLV
ncbi:Hypothetical predicted protein [Octopus vulgaris]|uniref:Uncharacterized protein n=1 Tax=Octopus vulgaris TaxID=6645 RepID=A0AA36AGL6_OCTVU|nr:Hypothetical predicted protein [Octopus vulgaris]